MISDDGDVQALVMEYELLIWKSTIGIVPMSELSLLRVLSESLCQYELLFVLQLGGIHQLLLCWQRVTEPIRVSQTDWYIIPSDGTCSVQHLRNT